jgi:hypothetical protein
MKIRITYELGNPDGLRWFKQPAYRWDCPCCQKHGRHHFDRFTDRGGVAKVHPYVRCWQAVEYHLWRHHRVPDCVLCGQGPATVGEHCKPCHEWWEYWHSLTPEEKQQEDQAMAEYGMDGELE